MKCYIGIDPGAKGAMSIIEEDGEVDVIDFAKFGIKGYTSILNTRKEDIVMVGLELVHSMPGQGVKSMFSFGQRYGEIQGMLQALKVGYELIRPKEWQKTCKVPPKSNKKGIYNAISIIYPDAELLGARGGVLDGRCDALGIAHQIRRNYNDRD